MKNEHPSKYTAIRRFYAWTGFIVWAILAPILLSGFVYFINFVITHANEVL